ncbi:hypothetical protein [Paenibacillus monticola]|nr:hypothetical protein [Paenibacillus monticola]
MKYFADQLNRFLTRKMIVTIMERVARPKPTGAALSTQASGKFK